MTAQAAEHVMTEATFTNPIVERGADPWVVQWRGAYYLCQSRRNAVWVNRSERLLGIGREPWSRVWRPERGQAWSRELWAPELHYLRGRWYIYVAADDGDNANHRMYVLEGATEDPEGPFVLKGKIAAPTDRWAIDGTVLQMPDERLYFAWSGWEGVENVAQHLYIAPMSDPLTISGERVRIASPEHDWERIGRPWVNEGPQALWHGDRLFVIYSASGSWDDDYCLGRLDWTGGDPLDPASWAKHPEPVFSRTDQVFGPGHASFVKSRDSREDWIVYHAARYSHAGWDRNIRTQRFHWRPDGTPDFGIPVPAGVPLPLPGGEDLE